MTLKLRKLDLDEFRQVYEEYLLKDFPRLEQKPFYFLEKMYGLNKYICYISEENGEIKGYASFIWENEDSVLLDYFATVSNERGRGIGSKMLELLKEEFDHKLIMFECENPVHSLDEDDKITRERRIKFYEKNGASISDVYIKLFGVNYRVMYISKYKIREKEIKEELEFIYNSMFPKFLFRKLARVI